MEILLAHCFYQGNLFTDFTVNQPNLTLPKTNSKIHIILAQFTIFQGSAVFPLCGLGSVQVHSLNKDKNNMIVQHLKKAKTASVLHVKFFPVLYW